MPLRDGAGRHHVGVAGEADERAGGSSPQPDVRHAVRDERIGAESEGREPRRHEFLATRVVGCERTPLDERAGKGERVGVRQRGTDHGHLP